MRKHFTGELIFIFLVLTITLLCKQNNLVDDVIDKENSSFNDISDDSYDKWILYEIADGTIYCKTSIYQYIDTCYWLCPPDSECPPPTIFYGPTYCICAKDNDCPSGYSCGYVEHTAFGSDNCGKGGKIVRVCCESDLCGTFMDPYKGEYGCECKSHYL